MFKSGRKGEEKKGGRTEEKNRKEMEEEQEGTLVCETLPVCIYLDDTI